MGRSDIPFSKERHLTSSSPLSNRREKTLTFLAAMKIEKNPIPKRPIGVYPDAWIPGNSSAQPVYLPRNFGRSPASQW